VAGVAVGERWFRVGPNGVRLVQLGAIGATLREPAFRAYMSANAVSVIGTWMQRTAIGWYAWELTASPFWLGMVAFADLFPAVFVGPFAGVLADRHDRRRIMLWTQGSLAVVTLVTALLIMAGQIGILGLVLLTGLKGCLIGVNQPARLALVPALVSRQNLPAAIALNSVVFNGARFVGPALAGLAIVASGVPAALIVNALSYVPLLFVLPRLALSEAVAPGAWQGAGAALKDGLRYIARSPVLGPLFAFFIALSLSVRPLGDLLPGFAEGVFGAGVEGLATLSAAMGLGAVLGGLWVARLGGAFDIKKTLRLQLGVAATAAAFALSPSFWLAIPAIAAFGFVLVACGIGLHTAIQMGVEPALRGRVMSFFGLVFRSVPALGALATGALAEAVGLRAAMLAAAAVFLVVYLWLQRRLMAGAAGE
jgi:MFS family permease